MPLGFDSSSSITESTAARERVDADATLRLALPKGRMGAGVLALLADCGLPASGSDRGYRPTLPLPNVETKLMKPQNIVEMLAQGSRDLGFAGQDWVLEKGAQLVEVLDCGLDPVRLVLAAPPALLDAFGRLPARPLRIATEYVSLTKRYLAQNGREATVVRTYGATEVFPPDDADAIVDNTATGTTLRENNLVIVDELMTSSTRLYASERAMRDPRKAERIAEIASLVQSVLEARARVLVELNVSDDALAAVLAVLPCMKNPTLARLAGDAGWAVKSAVPRPQLARVLTAVKRAGGTDVVVSRPSQILA